MSTNYISQFNLEVKGSSSDKKLGHSFDTYLVLLETSSDLKLKERCLICRSILSSSEFQEGKVQHYDSKRLSNIFFGNGTDSCSFASLIRLAESLNQDLVESLLFGLIWSGETVALEVPVRRVVRVI